MSYTGKYRGEPRETSSLMGMSRIAGMASDYYRALNTLMELFCLNPHFDPKVIGSGMDEIPALLKLMSCGGAHEGDANRHMYLQHYEPSMQVLYVFRNITVLREGVGISSPYINCPVVLYYSSVGDLGAVRLQLSSRTHEVISRNRCGLLLSECTILQSNDHGVPKFCMSAKRVLECFQQSVHKHLVLHHCPHLVNFTPEPCLPRVSSKVIAQEVYIVPMMPVFLYHGWPDVAHGWLARHRPHRWPTRALREDIARQPIYIVPFCYKHGTSCGVDNDEWTFCFSQAEAKLFESISDAQKCVFVVVADLLEGTVGALLSVDAIKAAFLWTLEEQPPAFWTFMNIEYCFDVVFAKMQKFIINHNWPHYFMENVNVIAHLDEAECEVINCQLQTMLKDSNLIMYTCYSFGYFTDRHYFGIDTAVSFCQNQPASKPDADTADCSCDVVKEMRRLSDDTGRWTRVSKLVAKSLCKSFDKCVRLLHFQHFMAMHNHATMQGCIELQEMALKRVLESKQAPVRIAPLAYRLISYLGSLCYEEAHSFDGLRRNYCVQMAEAYLAASHPLDARLYRTKLAHLRFLQRRYNETISILTTGRISSQAPTDTHASQLLAQLSPITTIASRNKRSKPGFETRLWYRWINMLYTCKLIISPVELSSFPPVIRQNFTFFHTPILGMNKRACAIMDSQFLTDMLLAMSYTKVGKRQSAFALLDKMQLNAETPQWDNSEIRQLGYLNCIAHCYMQIGSVDGETIAAYLLKKSLWYMPYFTNSARWLLFDYRLKKVKQLMMVVTGVSFFSACALKVFRLIQHYRR